MSYPFKEMNSREIAEFVEAPRHALVATNRQGKAPLVTPVWYLFDAGRLLFGVHSTSAKYRTLSRDPNLSICIDGSHPDARAVTLYGTAEVFAGPDELANDFQWRIARRYLPSDDETQRYLDQSDAVGEMVLFIVTPDKVIARDYN